MLWCLSYMPYRLHGTQSRRSCLRYMTALIYSRFFISFTQQNGCSRVPLLLSLMRTPNPLAAGASALKRRLAEEQELEHLNAAPLLGKARIMSCVGDGDVHTLIGKKLQPRKFLATLYVEWLISASGSRGAY